MVDFVSSNSPPLVSIIIPCWNAAQYIGEAIASALAQTYPNIEVIVIDDGSTDGSLDVIQSFGERIRWETGPNQGGCAARNRGLSLAKGDLIQFLDADDWLLPQKLERQVPLMLENPDRIVYCDHLACWTDNSSKPVIRSRPMDEQDPIIFILQHRSLHTTGPIHRREWLLEIGGFRAGLRACQEFDLHLRLAARGQRFLHLPEVLFTVRRRPDSVSSNTGRTFACLLDFMPEIIADLQHRGELSPTRRVEFAVYAARAGRLCFRDGYHEAGLMLLNIAATLDKSAADHAAYSLPARIAKNIIGPLGVERIANIRRFINRVTQQRIS